MNARTVALVVLTLVAAASGWLAWQLRERAEVPPLVGPPRSDYALHDFEMVALDDAGEEAFSVTGPRLVRHPFLQTLTLDEPRLRFPDRAGGEWRAAAGAGWVAADGDELHLTDDVRVDGPFAPPQPQTALRTQSLRLYPDTDTVASDAVVTLTQAGSILRARGLRGDLAARRYDLLHDVEATYDPTRR